jgi:CheY-like chemotaxis protein
MKGRLLIVEDNELNRELLVQIFEGAYELELAMDGETAVDRAREAPPDAILMDISLPGISGLDAVRAIRSSNIDIPIVAVSSCVMPSDRANAFSAGVDEFVPKPIDDVALVDLVDRLVAAT